MKTKLSKHNQKEVEPVHCIKVDKGVLKTIFLCRNFRCKFTLPIQAFIQAVLLMSTFEQKLQLGVSKGLYTLQRVHGGVLLMVQGLKPLKNVCLLISGRQINSFKQKKPSKLIYFECKFNANML